MPGVSEEEKESIRKEARELLKSFGKSIETVKITRKAEKKCLQGFREEGSGDEPNIKFRDAMFSNAPNKSEDFILAEKKKW